MTDFRFIRSTDNVSWQSGDSRPIALVDISPAEMEGLLGVVLERGTDEGLGPWQGIGLRLPSGRDVGVLWHELKPEPRGFVIEADAHDNIIEARREFLSLIDVIKDRVIWVPDE